MLDCALYFCPSSFEVLCIHPEFISPAEEYEVWSLFKSCFVETYHGEGFEEEKGMYVFESSLPLNEPKFRGF